MWRLQVIGTTAVVAFQFSTKKFSPSAKAGFLTCVLPHQVAAGATGTTVLKVRGRV